MKPQSKHTSNAQAFLALASIAMKVVAYRSGEVVFSQGTAAPSVMCVQKGRVKISVRSQAGKEVVLATLGPGDFFGEGCLTGQPVRMGSATTVTPSAILILKKATMVRLLRTQPELADRFISHLLITNIRFEEDLTSHLLNHDEKRLARTLLLLARYGKADKPRRMLPRMSPAVLAKTVGATRSKVELILKKFKKLGFIEADDNAFTIHDSLLSVVLHE